MSSTLITLYVSGIYLHNNFFSIDTIPSAYYAVNNY